MLGVDPMCCNGNVSFSDVAPLCCPVLHVEHVERFVSQLNQGVDTVLLNPVLIPGQARHAEVQRSDEEGAAELGVLDLSPVAAAGPAFSSIAVDGESYNCGETAKAFLVESEEELYMVRLLSRGFNEANVYKMDFSGQRWRPVHDLGGRAFFVAPLNFGVSCLAGDQYGIQQNCVYSLVNLADKSLNMFNVEDGTAERRDIGEAYVSVAEHGINTQHPMLGTHHRMIWMVPTNL